MLRENENIYKELCWANWTVYRYVHLRESSQILVVMNLHDRYFNSKYHFQVRSSRIAKNSVT